MFYLVSSDEVRTSITSTEYDRLHARSDTWASFVEGDKYSGIPAHFFVGYR